MTLTPATEQKVGYQKDMVLKRNIKWQARVLTNQSLSFHDERAMLDAGLDCDDQVVGTVYRELTKA